MKKGISVFISIILIHSAVFTNDSITFPVYFKFDSHEIDTNEAKSLRIFFEMFILYNVDSIKVDGFCDDIGSVEYNLDLSEKRALMIMDLLKDKYPLRSVKGHGSVSLINSIDTSILRSQNRRVSITLYYSKLASRKQLREKEPDWNYAPFFYKGKVGDKMRTYLKFENGNAKLKQESYFEIKQIYNVFVEVRKKIEVQSYFHEVAASDSSAKKLAIARARFLRDYFIGRKIDSNRIAYKCIESNIFNIKNKELLNRIELQIIE